MRRLARGREEDLPVARGGEPDERDLDPAVSEPRQYNKVPRVVYRLGQAVHRHRLREKRFLTFIVFILGDLSQLIRFHKQSAQPLSEEFVMKCLVQIARALAYLFDKKILHRDIKTQNILLDEHQNIKIGDFGISKQLDNSTDLAKTSLGT